MGKATRSVTELLSNLTLIPNFDTRLRGIVTVFKNGIQPMYEDAHNKRGLLVRFSLIRTEERQEAIKNAIKTETDEKKRTQQRRRLSSVIDPCEQLVWYYMALALTGAFDPDEGNMNGLYIHTEEDVIKIDLWYDEAAKNNSRKQIMERAMGALHSLDEVTGYEFEGANRTIADSFQTIDMADYGGKPTIRGTS